MERKNHFAEWDDPTECIRPRAEIDLALCDGCKLCVEVCPGAELELFGEKGSRKAKVKLDRGGCLGCNNCHAICARGAISVSQSYNFVGYYRLVGRGPFSHPRRF